MNFRHAADEVPEERSFDRLIRAAGEIGDTGFVRPSDDLIEAFVLGSASPGEREVVQRALEASSDFRREILGMLRDLESLAADKSQPGVEATGRPVPQRAEFLRSQRSAGAPGRPWIRKVASLAAVLALVAAAGFWWRQASRETPPVITTAWTLVEADVDPGLLLADKVRGWEDVTRPTHLATPQDAAVAAFRSDLRLEGRRIVPRTAEGAPLGESAAGFPVTIVLMDRRRTVSFELQVPLPGIRVTSSSDATAWALGLPSRSLLTISLTSDSLVAPWPFSADSIGLVTVTYAVEGGFGSTSARVIRR